MHLFTNPSSLEIQSTGGYGYGPINTGSTGTPDLTKKFDVSATFKMSEHDKLYACQDSMMVVQPYRKADNSIHPDLVNVILRPIKSVDIPFPVKYYVIRGVQKNSFITGTTIVNIPATHSDFITNFWLNWNTYKTDTSQPTLPDPGPSALGYEVATPTLDNRKLAKIFNNSIPTLAPVKVSEGQWIGNLKKLDIISFEVIISTETLALDFEYLRKHKQEIDVTALLALPVTDENAFNLRAEREKILSYVDPAAFFGMHYDFVITLGDAKTPKTGEEIYLELLAKFSTKSRLYIDVRSEKGYSYNFYLNYGDIPGNRMKVKYATGAYADDPYLTNNWPIFYTDTIVTSDTFSFIDIKLRKDDNVLPMLVIEDGKLQGMVTSPIIQDAAALFPVVADWTTDISLQVPNYDNGTTKENIGHHIRLNYYRTDNTSTVPEVIKNIEIFNSGMGAINTSADLTSLMFEQYKNDRYLYSPVPGGSRYIAESGVFFDGSNALLYSQRKHTILSSGNAYPKVDFTRVNSNQVIQNALFPKDIAFNKFSISISGTIVEILEIVGANTSTVYTNEEDVLFLGLTKVELALLQNAPGLSDLHHRYISFTFSRGTDDAGIPYFKAVLDVVGLDADGKEKTVSPTTLVEVYGGSLNVFCSKLFAASTSVPNLLRDPLKTTEFEHVGRWGYDSNDTEVQSVDPNGLVKIKDFNGAKVKRKVELKGNVYYPEDTPGGGLSTRNTDYPLIVILHGNGHNYTNYDQLGRFLAANGFIVTSVNCLNYTGSKRYKLTPTGDPTWTHYFAGADGYTYFLNPAVNQIMILTEDIHTGAQTPLILTDWVINVDFKIKPTTGTPDRIIFDKKIGEGGMNSLGRANLLPLHLKIIQNKFTTTVQNNIGIIGHSRGGEAVVRAAKDVTSALAHPNLFQINAVMSLAPTDIWDKENLTQDIPYFVLYGSKDGDVSGISVFYPRADGSGTTNQGSGAFSLYDRAINNTSKSMTFVYGATHNGFINNNNDYRDLSNGPLADVNTQKAICMGYSNAFFRQNLRGETEWDELIQGHYTPASIPSKKIYQQFKNMAGSSVVVDDFEGTITATSWETSALGKPVTYSGTKPEDGVFREGTSGIDEFSPHDTQGVKVTWAGGEKLKFELSSTGLDVQALTHLSFRISHVVKLGSAYSSLDTMKIRLKDAVGNEKELEINQSVPAPDTRYDATIGGWTDNKELTKSALMTIRMRLLDFMPDGTPGVGNVDLSQVEELEFTFPTTGSGAVDMDSIEFTN